MVNFYVSSKKKPKKENIPLSDSNIISLSRLNDYLYKIEKDLAQLEKTVNKRQDDVLHG